MSAFVELQNAIFDHLDADEDVVNSVVGIYDNPLQVSNPDDNAQFPFITVGDAQSSEWDTDTETGFESTVTIHTWSRAHHHIECKDIQGRVYKSLHRANIMINGYHLVTIDQISQDAQRDPDSITIHGVQLFRVLFERIEQ